MYTVQCTVPGIGNDTIPFRSVNARVQIPKIPNNPHIRWTPSTSLICHSAFGT